MSEQWTDHELKETVKAYIHMLQMEQDRIPYNKAEMNRNLKDGVLNSRTKSSIEYRMQNISAALEELCIPYIEGYKPARNVGNNVKDRIRRILDGLGHIDSDIFEPTDNQDELEKKTSEIHNIISKGLPRGNNKPNRSLAEITRYERDPLVKAWVLKNANGTCEGCGHPSPFKKKDGTPYLEVHHLIPLSEEGPDNIPNAVALCPNCHSRCHNSIDSEIFTGQLKGKIIRPQHY
jgi:5-methylcytosine-specific restriction protein A